ncbi:MAG: DinB family protein [Phaeodactylibacter sp.]|nr:DinB family protein [Phaeodactylibacter sp.]
MNRWTPQIDKTTQDFKQAFGSLTAGQMNWKPHSGTWSIAQNIDHLIVINESYYPVLQALRNGTYQLPFMAKLGFMVSFLGKAILKSVQPDRKRKMKTFPIWEPSESQVPPGVLDRFAQHQSELKSLIENSADLIQQGVIISSPANKNIVYRLETAFDIIVTHEQRHLEQAKEVLQMMNSEGA